MKLKMLLAALVSMMLCLCLFGCGGEDYEDREYEDDEMISSVMDNEDGDDNGFDDEDEDEDDD